MSEPDETRAFADAFNKRRAIGIALQELHAAEDSGNGLHVWRAYLACRREDAPLPPELLAALDQVAASLLRAANEAEIAAALNMATRQGGTALQRFNRREKTRRAIVAFLQMRHASASVGAGHTERALIEAAIRNHGLKIKWQSLRRMVNDWERREKQRRGHAVARRVRSVFELGSGAGS